ncbi:hypothetical protein GCM10012285_59060 [Streptomyces kronopolitis]|uniref:Uncharacterized protein n=1 Tax=Streptomyces kronopolitis TaxID=1612435 RepID=A0ABQ2JZV1_9ACTN|nr:hypothetical protein [Streptomyces kronopolitis]GGN60744.1 hypothetical protein GCM10012285_59060 [Streptomyces kronopolitis]
MKRYDIADRVRAVLPVGEQGAKIFVVTHINHSEAGGGDVPKSVRPKVLVGHRMPGDGWARVFSVFGLILKLVINDLPSPGKGSDDPEYRVTAQQRNHRFFGTWDGLAGRIMAASQPLCTGGVVTAIAVSESTLRFVYWQNRRWGVKIGDAYEMGPCFRRDTIAWTRRRGKRGGDVQIGFVDGSWGTLLLPAATEFLAEFPGSLTADDPVP